MGVGRGSFYGPITDTAAYAAILNHDFEFFIGLMRQLARYLIDERISLVVGDAMEGYNPTHDACRLIIGAAVEIVKRNTGRELESFDFLLTGKPDDHFNPIDNHAIRLELDDDAFARKIAVARSYSELESEVNGAIAENRLDAFRIECLRRVPNRSPIFPAEHKPYYEQYGERQVSSGHYHQVIRYRDHLAPLAEAIWRQVEAGCDLPENI